MNPAHCLDYSRQRHLGLAETAAVAAIDREAILAMVPQTTDTCLITVIYSAN